MLSSQSVSSRRPRLVLVAADVVGSRMAGPGIRFVKIAEQLTTVADVTLAVGIEGSDVDALTGRGFAVRAYRGRDELIALVHEHDIAFCQLIDEEVVRQGLEAGCRFIFDLYNVLPAEAIGSERIGGFETQPEMDEVYRGVVSFFRSCMRSGSYFVTSNDRQRDFWIGYLLASDGLLPSQLQGRTAEELIGLLPFGMNENEPDSAGRDVRAELGIASDDLLLLWAGGIWDWFDAETPIRAVAELRSERHDVHLVFYGTTHPNSLIGKPKAVERAQALAEELNVLDVGVHFVEGWMPADARGAYLTAADVAVSGHRASFETRYAFRTRILDHFWASLPSIVTQGDWFAEYIESEGLGEVVGYGDVAATKAAIVSLSDPARRAAARQRITRVREQWRWRQTTAGLREVVARWEDLPPAAPHSADPAPALPAPAPSVRQAVRFRLSMSPIAPVYRSVRGTLSRSILGVVIRAFRRRS